jgi:hypothetical protein
MRGTPRITSRPFHAAYAREGRKSIQISHTLSICVCAAPRRERERERVYVLENSLRDELKVAIKNKLSTALYAVCASRDPAAAHVMILFLTAARRKETPST